VQKIGQPVVVRHREATERPKAFELLGQAIQLMGKVVEAYNNKVCWQLILVENTTANC
jgi:3-hydroxyisobutyrate dehydrogenase-like beta-hydroxyacid dehydrogenase